MQFDLGEMPDPLLVFDWVKWLVEPVNLRITPKADGGEGAHLGGMAVLKLA